LRCRCATTHGRRAAPRACRDERPIDRAVYDVRRLQTSGPFAYAVDDGERSGVWLARLAPASEP